MSAKAQLKYTGLRPQPSASLLKRKSVNQGKVVYLKRLKTAFREFSSFLAGWYLLIIRSAHQSRQSHAGLFINLKDL